MDKPRLGDMVHYRGRVGYLAMRSAVVTATVGSLDPRGVEAGDIPGLDSEYHVHLTVFSPGTNGSFQEYNVPLGTADAEDNGTIPPGTWCPRDWILI